ncbi:hypothetical protein BGZ96_011293 [Linnemannia gamsii]|uniref:Uncharacterized protein n=1 Tax=Linnemannia gamsii TaxID=64522 RepID=A0ABQ7JTI1_9FUNG|nr:hypothetical protein BGZ96_011293 [Linnemannia gamsii]
MSKQAYDTATTGVFPQYPPARPGPSSSNAPPCPPSYEEAISHQHSVSTPPTPASNQQQQQYHPSSEDFVKVDHDNLEMDQDMDEEQDYEESRPLKMGRIPNTRAQYTFIQPNDTIQAGKKKRNMNNNCSSTCSTPEIDGSPLPPHPGYPQHQHPESAYHHPPHHLQYAAPPHDLMQRPYTVPTPGNNSMQRLYPVSGPTWNAPSAPPSAPDTAPPTLYAPPSMPPPPLEQFNDTKQIHPPVDNTHSEFGSEVGSPSSSAAVAPVPATTYAPPPFPPPQSLSAQEAPLAGVPSLPGLMNSQDISIAEFKRSKKGVESCDSILGDPYQLYRFFVAHNDRPTLHVIIKGHHIEKRETYETDSDGKRKLVLQDHYVEDFNMDFDLTSYVVPRGALYTAPDAKTGAIPTIKEVLEQFADEENPFKEMHMHKSIQWDYEELTKAITHAIRSVNYRHSISISYPCTNNVRAIYKKVKDKTLKSEFQMAMTTRDFYMQYYWSIVDQVQYR